MLGFELRYWLVLPCWLPVGLCGTQLVGITSSQKATVFRIHKSWRHMPILLCKCWQRKVALAQKKITDSSEWCSIMTSCDSQLLPDQRSSSPCHCCCSQHSQAPAVGWPSAYCFVCSIFSFETEKTPDSLTAIRCDLCMMAVQRYRDSCVVKGFLKSSSLQ